MYVFNAAAATEKCVNWIRDWFEENGKGCNAVIGISGGKDSTVVAALCVKALGRDRVIGIMMPNGEQSDINDSYDVVSHLKIKALELNIGDMFDAAVAAYTNVQFPAEIPLSRQSMENLPPRLRMTALYMVSQSMNGRVSNNCNFSENWIGYSTIYGDTAGDFAPIANFTVSEVIAIGKVLGVPERFLVKPPADGLCGQTDEDRFGFTYAVLDKYLRTGEINDMNAKMKINAMHKVNRFKHEPMAAFPWEA